MHINHRQFFPLVLKKNYNTIFAVNIKCTYDIIDSEIIDKFLSNLLRNRLLTKLLMFRRIENARWSSSYK